MSTQRIMKLIEEYWGNRPRLDSDYPGLSNKITYYEIDEVETERYTGWVKVDGEDFQKQIAVLVEALKQLVAAVKHDNKLTDQDKILTEIERSQLMAILEAAIIELSSPYVDRGRFEDIKNGIGKILKRSAEKEVSTIVQSALRNAYEEASKFVGKLIKETNFTDFWS